MYSTEQAETMAKALTEAQKQMWESWMGLMRAAPTPMPVSPAMADQWRDAATEAFKGWTTEAEQIAKDVGHRLINSQDCVLRFLELSLNSWNAIAPKVEAGEDWNSVLAKYTERLREQFLLSPQAAQKATQDTNELWGLYLEQWQKLVQPWASSLQQAPWRVSQASTGDGSALVELMHLYGNAYERTFGRLIESPSLGHTRELNEDLIKGFSAWVEYRQASFAYQVQVGETWTHAFEEFMRNLIARTEKGETVESLKQLLFQWIDIIDQVFAKAFRSDHYIQLQGHLLNTAMTYRLREREIVEVFLKTSHVPYRSEMDEAHRRIYHLRREVKELKKAVRAIKAELSNQIKSQPVQG